MRTVPRLALACCVLLFGVSLSGAATARPRVTVTVLSSRPDFVSGGDALLGVRVSGSAATPRAALPVAFARRADGSWAGLVHGLRPGWNRVTVTAGGASGSVLLRDFPRQGPMLSGPREAPYICQTANFVTVAGRHLPPSANPDCAVPTQVDLVYRSTLDNGLHPLPHNGSRPWDLAWVDARTPYIVRVETGVINRSIYEVAVLADRRGADWRHPPPGWNGKLVYTFGGGCPGGWYTQGHSTGWVTEDHMLRGGFAVVSSSLNVFGNNCDELLAAETTAMTKEHVVEEFGVPRYTIGWGCSGGSYQVHQIGDNYPGLLDGIVAGCSFPEVGFSTVSTITDARLLQHYFADSDFDRAQQRAVAGFGKWATISTLADAARRIDPRVFCPPELPAGQRYDPLTNPGGARCDVFDHAVNVYGRDPRTGMVRRPLDNVGVQYGLGALRAGVISVAQFLDMNQRIGGFDADGTIVARRTVADPRAVRTAYRTGRLLSGGAGLRTTPIIDYRYYSDDFPVGDIHLRFQSFATRARLVKANGDAANQVMLVEDGRHPVFSTDLPVPRYAFDAMVRWLDALPSRHDRAGMLRAKPADLADSCWTRDPVPQRIVAPQLPGVDTTRCNTLYPVWPAPRQVAGEDVAGDVLKCALAPPRRADYPPMTNAQWGRLRAVFPGGVCQWNRPGIGSQGLAGTWLTAGIP